MRDVVVVAVIAAAYSGLAGAAGFLLLPALRRRPVSWSLASIVLLGPLAVLVAVVGTAAAMFVSGYDVMVVAVSVVVATAVVLGVAVTLARRIVGGSAELRDAVRRFAHDGTFVAPREPATAELAAVGVELEQALDALETSRRREHELETSRRDLVAWVSHDLRSPLAGLRAMAEALEDGVAADPERYHKQIRTQTDRLTRMVDDLFELARLDAGSAAPPHVSVSLPDVVSDALAAAEAVAAGRGVHVDGRVVTMPPPVSGDVRGLSRIVANLLTNAIQHTPPGGSVTVKVGAAGNHALISVADGCGGIPDDELDRVFDVAWRGSPARTPSDDDGAGLGLAIVRGLVAAHSGTVTVRNAGGGCRFDVRLPVTG